MADVIRVAAGQIRSGEDPTENLDLVKERAREAAEAGAHLLVLPEATMASFTATLRDVAEPLDGPWARAVRGIAAEHGITVVAGMFEPADDGRVHNTLLATGPGVEDSYRKIHLFDAFGGGESKIVAPGTRHVTIEVPTPGRAVTVGLATCYDVRFADQFTALGRAGARLVVLPASWAEGPGKADQWDLLVRARAMDAQAWMLACDQAWTTPKGRAALGLGRSAVVAPDGHVRARLGADAGLLVADLDLDVVDATRKNVPVL